MHQHSTSNSITVSTVDTLGAWKIKLQEEREGEFSPWSSFPNMSTWAQPLPVNQNYFSYIFRELDSQIIVEETWDDYERLYEDENLAHNRSIAEKLDAFHQTLE